MTNILIRKNSFKWLLPAGRYTSVWILQRVYLFGLVVASTFSFGNFSLAQIPANSPAKDEPFVEVQKTGWSDAGDLVVSIRLHASATRGLKLVGSVKVLKPLGVTPDPDLDLKPFSLEESYLVDEYTQAKIPAKDEVPYKPYFGPCKLDVTVNLDKGGWMQLGVAFPAPPPPPVTPGGAKQDYKFVLYLPASLGAKPVNLRIPAR